MDILLAESLEAGTRPTVVELARRLGLANSTFWRCFPDLAEKLREAARTPQPSAATSDNPHKLEHRVAILAHENQQLREHLDLAIANLARLSIDNQRLRDELHARNDVTVLPTRPPGS